MSEIALGKQKRNVESENLADDFDNDDLSDDSEPQIPEAHGPMTFQLPYRHKTANEQHAQANPRGVILRTRIVFNSKYATKSFDIPAHQGQRVHLVLQKIQEMFPQIKIEGRHDRDNEFHPSRPNDEPALFFIDNAAFLFQETNYKSRSLRRTRWNTCHTAHGIPYRNWYNRNIIAGTATTLAVEVRLWTAGMMDQLQLLGAAGRGEAHMNNEPFQLLDMQHIADENGLRTLLCTPEVEPMTTPMEPGTLEVFPARQNPTLGGKLLSYAEIAADNKFRLSKATKSVKKWRVKKLGTPRKSKPQVMRNISKRFEKMQILDQDEVDGADPQLQASPAAGGVGMDIDG
jgi:hypothetical protein